MVKLDRICREANVILIFARSYGLTGFVRISLKVLWYSFSYKLKKSMMPEDDKIIFINDMILI
jgi:amyloid beta precursor protein binding protein 1